MKGGLKYKMAFRDKNKPEKPAPRWEYFVLRVQSWLQNSTATISLSMIGMVIVGLLLWGYGKQVYNLYQVTHEPADVVKFQRQNEQNFVILGDPKPVKNSDGTITLTYDLYIKHPFANADKLNSELSTFCQTVREKYNAGSPHHVRAIGIRLYDRKLVYDMGLTPRGTAMYMMDTTVAAKIGANQDKKEERQQGKQKQRMINPATGGKGQYITANSSLSPVQLAWKETLDTKNKVNYKNWALTTQGLLSYHRDAVSKPLSDQEFAFWLKIKEYERLLGTNNVDPAVQLYLNYDLNGMTNQNDFISISKEFDKFNKREVDLGDETNYFPNRALLLQNCAIYRPQLLYFILSNGKMVKSYSKAQKKLVDKNSSEYASVIKQHMDKVSHNTDSYGKVDYYHEMMDGKLRNVDPFSGIVGKKKSSSMPYFQRPDFSPIPELNNAWYAQQNVGTISGQDIAGDE